MFSSPSSRPPLSVGARVRIADLGAGLPFPYDGTVPTHRVAGFGAEGVCIVPLHVPGGRGLKSYITSDRLTTDMREAS